ncbi:hypothetical protein HanRHA438_Chr00c33g0855471 [Helianthus annuus]|nr:hypothetical protein HanRHA438_Chr00c33g0855471 [Helianthus annuus]
MNIRIQEPCTPSPSPPRFHHQTPLQVFFFSEISNPFVFPKRVIFNLMGFRVFVSGF